MGVSELGGQVAAANFLLLLQLGTSAFY
jgi:hypothetical protein